MRQKIRAFLQAARALLQQPAGASLDALRVFLAAPLKISQVRQSSSTVQERRTQLFHPAFRLLYRDNEELAALLFLLDHLLFALDLLDEVPQRELETLPFLSDPMRAPFIGVAGTVDILKTPA